MRAAAPRIVDNRALLATISQRLVRTVAGESSRYAAALFGVVLKRKPPGESWTPTEWASVLDELDTSTLTIGQFLEAEHARPRG